MESVTNRQLRQEPPWAIIERLLLFVPASVNRRADPRRLGGQAFKTRHDVADDEIVPASTVAAVEWALIVRVNKGAPFGARGNCTAVVLSELLICIL
ncbi:hypothetical protein [Bradyrhizobium sp. CB3481]|uniref:hypothetical protein n=1 Tax=Bradyrhizobium sp. CB3481 TaxID=3039158 RepID=UPI0024B1E199|nr:hypothetical protein [Bradyrhizobium sp. CB3481]WFU13617.1 hypothetical protein QA643_20400 [Bradyrhizobium sp. CB3481]